VRRRKVFGFGLACAVVAALSAAGPSVASAAPMRVSVPSAASKAPATPRPVVAKVSPSSGADTGGTRVTVTGKNFSKVSKVVFGSAAGSALKVESSTRLLVTTPKHAVGAVNVTVVTAHGDSAAVKAGRFSFVTPAEAVTWGPWKRVDGNGSGNLVAPGCLTATHCLAFDGDGGQLVTWNGGTWSPPTPVKLTTTAPFGQVAETSCPTSTFCMAVGGDGIALRYSGGTWTRLPKPSGSVMIHVSCASPAFCAATDNNGDVTEYNGKTWTKGVQLDGARYPDDDVSCVSARFCVLADDADGIFAWNGMSWKQTVTALPGASGSLALSCVSSAWCLAVDGDGHVYKYAGSSWAAAGSTGISGTLGNLACTSETFCLIGGSGGDVGKYDGTSWTLSAGVFDAGNAQLNPPDVSCVGQTCVAVADDFYDAVSFANAFVDGRWTGQSTADKSGQLDAVSCPTTSFCAAVGGGKYAVTWQQGRWTAPVYLPSALQPYSLSCSSATFCLAADDDGPVWRYNGRTWATIASPTSGSPGILGLSCASPTFCAAVVVPSTGSEGHPTSSGLLTFNGSTWSSVKSWAGNTAGWGSVSCPTPKFCMLSDRFGDLAAFNGTSWRQLETPYSFWGWSIVCTSATFCVSAVQPTGAGTNSGVVAFNGRRWTYTKLLPANQSGTAPEVTGASCAPRSEFCLATTDNGRVFSYNGTQWSRSAPIGGLSPNDVSCASARLCVAVDGSGSAAIGT
jgi:IPT/TIG domain